MTFQRLLLTFSVSFFLLSTSTLGLQALDLTNPDNAKLMKNNSAHSALSTVNSTPSDKTIQEPIISPVIQGIITDLNHLKKDIVLQRYTKAITMMTDMINQLKRNRQQHISTFFPNTFQDYAVEENTEQSAYFSDPSDEYGVLFSRKYINQDGRAIAINVVFSDPSINEYIKTIEDPARIKKLNGAHVITIQNQYKAIEKYDIDEQYCEQNIVLNTSLLVNVIAININDKNLLYMLTNQIQLNALEKYLQ